MELFLGNLDGHLLDPFWLEDELDLLQVKICIGEFYSVLRLALDGFKESVDLYFLGGHENSALLFIFLAQ